MTGNDQIRRLWTDRQLALRSAGALVELARGRARGHRGARISRGVSLTGTGTYRLGHRSALREDSKFFVGQDATFDLGPGAAIGARCVVNVLAGLFVGRGTHISWQCQILDSDFHEIWDLDGTHRPVSAPITLGEHVLVGTGSLILKGVNIGNDAVIAAGSVVIRDVEPYTVVAGNPAKFVAPISKWV